MKKIDSSCKFCFMRGVRLEDELKVIVAIQDCSEGAGEFELTVYKDTEEVVDAEVLVNGFRGDDIVDNCKFPDAEECNLPYKVVVSENGVVECRIE